MKTDEHFSPRSRMLLFSTLELLRKEIRSNFSDWKDADDWMFGQLDFTKEELAQIYKGRNVLYYDGAAVDFEAAQKIYEASLPDFVSSPEVNILGQSLYLGSIKIFLGEDYNLLCKLPDESEPRNLRISIRDVREGDAFFFGETGTIRTTSDNAYQNHSEPDEPWVVYGDDGEVYFEEDIGSSFSSRVKDFLIGLSEKQTGKPTLEEQIQIASNRATESHSINNLPAIEPIMYKGWKIFENNGKYTVGGSSNHEFNDCTLENLGAGDEFELVQWCCSNGINLEFYNFRKSEYVDYASYLYHLDKYNDPEFSSDNEFIVPIALFESEKSAKSFIDWFCVREKETSDLSLESKIQSASVPSKGQNKDKATAKESPER